MNFLYYKRRVDKRGHAKMFFIDFPYIFSAIYILMISAFSFSSFSLFGFIQKLFIIHFF